jgi:eukaryotic-like serine/threonine-protein kinase
MKTSTFFFLCLCLTSAAQAQSMFRGNAAHTGVYPGVAPREFHRVKWKFPTGARVVGSPVMKDKVIYFGSDDGNVYAVDAESGRQIWKVATRGPVPCTPALDHDMVYVGSYDGKFYALDAQSGAVKWKFATEGERRFEAKGLHGWQPKTQTFADAFDVFLSSPAVVEGKVYFGTSDSSLYHVVEAGNGKPILKKEDKAYMFSSPAVTNDVVFIGVLNGTLEARDRNSGDLLWEFQTEKSKQNANWILTAERKFNVPLLFFDAWREAPLVSADRQFAIGAIFSSPLVANGVVYFGSTDGFLYALD